jgi:hypothetical protein
MSRTLQSGCMQGIRRANIDPEGLEANLTRRHVISTHKQAKWVVYYASLSIVGHSLPSGLSHVSQRPQYVSQRSILLCSPPKGRNTH